MSSDLRLIKEFGEQLKPAAEQPPRDLRHRVLTGVAANRSNSRPATRFGMNSRIAITLAGAAAAVIVSAALVLPDVVGAANRPVAVPDPGVIHARTPTDVLALAVRNVADAAELSARPDQFIYTETVGVNQNLRGSEFQIVGERTMVRQWRAADGGGDILVMDRPMESADDVWRQRGSFPSDARALPTDGDAMHAYLYRPAGEDSPTRAHLGADGRAWERATTLLTPAHYPPAVRVAALTAMSRIPGLTMRTGAADMAGRSGVAVVHAGQGEQTEVVFDASTYRYLGTNQAIEVAGLPGHSEAMTIEVRTAVQRMAVVDKAGILPLE